MVAASPEYLQTIIDPNDAAQSAGLRYVSDASAGIRRRMARSGFKYARADGSTISDRNVLDLIKSLAIPPAWTDVWICPYSNGHIQATGRDAKGRKQYRYHARFREIRESTKFEHIVAFADALPAIREKVQEHMQRRGLTREKVLATVVKTEAESELRGEVQSLKPEEAAILALLRGSLAREAELSTSPSRAKRVARVCRTS